MEEKKSQISKTLKKLSNTNLQKIQNLDGYSNQVFLITDSQKKKYIFKFHKKSEKKNPFKILENHVLKIINFEFIYKEENFTVEKFIENFPLKKKNYFEEKNLIFCFFTISNFNKKKFIFSDLPNLYFILKLNKKIIFEKIRKNILNIENENYRNLILNNFLKINKIKNFYKKFLKKEKMVLSHNDLIYKNILCLNNSQERIKDFSKSIPKDFIKIKKSKKFENSKKSKGGVYKKTKGGRST